MKYKYIRVCLIIVGMIGVIWFALPYVYKSILNIGNVTGIGVFLCILLYGIFMVSVNQLIMHIWKYSLGKGLLVLISCIAAMILVLTITATTHMIIATTHCDDRNDVTVVVLGCKASKGKPSLMLRERLDSAYDYLIKHKEVPCILSGGVDHEEVMSEAATMYVYLKEKGIETSRLYIEESSRSTKENLLYTKKIIEDNHLPMNLCIVTSEFHEYRASLVARSIKLDSISKPARTALWLFPTYYVRELYGIVYEWVY